MAQGGMVGHGLIAESFRSHFHFQFRFRHDTLTGARPRPMSHPLDGSTAIAHVSSHLEREAHKVRLMRRRPKEWILPSEEYTHLVCTCFPAGSDSAA